MAQGLVRALIAALAAGWLLAAAPETHAQITLKSPSWAELSPQEKQVLAPLASDWDKLDASRKAKWRGLVQRYPSMQPDEQQRLQQQMHSWAALTPEQRKVAREQYKSMKTLPPEKKVEVRQKWEEYQSLPPETRKELAAKNAAPAGSLPVRPTGGARQPAPQMSAPPVANPGPTPASVPPK